MWYCCPGYAILAMKSAVVCLDEGSGDLETEGDPSTLLWREKAIPLDDKSMQSDWKYNWTSKFGESGMIGAHGKKVQLQMAEVTNKRKGGRDGDRRNNNKKQKKGVFPTSKILTHDSINTSSLHQVLHQELQACSSPVNEDTSSNA
jgi:hypothetical protein